MTGVYSVAVARPGEVSVEADDVIVVGGAERFDVEMDSNAPERQFGLGVAVAGLVVTVASLIVPFFIRDGSTADLVLGVGSTIGIAVGTAGAVLMVTADEVTLERNR